MSRRCFAGCRLSKPSASPDLLKEKLVSRAYGQRLELEFKALRTFIFRGLWQSKLSVQSSVRLACRSIRTTSLRGLHSVSPTAARLAHGVLGLAQVLSASFDGAMAGLGFYGSVLENGAGETLEMVRVRIVVESVLTRNGPPVSHVTITLQWHDR